jgi:glycosyltransferase involved in cell wall biosynthesis
VRALSRVSYSGTVEIIVVIDGSTDGTAAALAELECPFGLQPLEQDNLGLAAARNRGAAEASGDILLFLDDDMICEPDLLKQHARMHIAGADAVAGGFTEPDSLDRQSPKESVGSERDEAAVTTPFGIFGGHLSVRRSAFEFIGGFDERFTAKGGYGYEDTDLAHRLLKQFSIRRNSDALVHHRKLISPHAYISRAQSCASAETYLLAKHPELRQELLEWTGAYRISQRLRFLSAIPVLPRVMAELAASIAHLRSRLPLRPAPSVQILSRLAYTLTYWSAVKRTGRLSGL